MYQLIYMTFPEKEQAITIARRLVEQRLVAGVNIIPQAHSFYRWHDELKEADETIVFAQATSSMLPEIEKAVCEWHPHEVPCIITLPVTCGLPSFLAWIAANCGNASQ